MGRKRIATKLKHKKGFMDIQFNWIFILVIGVIILAFFISIAEKQKTVSNVKISSQIRSDLRTIFTGTRSSTGTASLIDLGGKPITFSCEGFAVADLSPVQEGVSFAPGSLQGYKLTAWSKDWSIPYRISNFLMITSPTVKYTLVGNSSLALELNKSLPAQFLSKGSSKQILFNRQSILLGADPASDGNYRVKFVFFNHDPVGTESLLKLTSLADADVSAINTLSTSLDGYGTVRFYKKFGNAWSTSPQTSYYLGKESLFAAVFSDDYRTYNCNMQRAFKNMAFITNIYKQRSERLKVQVTGTDQDACAVQYQLASNTLQDMYTKADQRSKTFPQSSSSAITDLYNDGETLKSYNRGLQSLSCSEVY